MRPTPLAACAIAIALAACGAEIEKHATRTLTGVTAEHALVSAQHALALEGLEVEEMSFEEGRITTTWQEKAHRLTRYTVSVAPDTSDADLLSIEVASSLREPALGGHSDPAPATLRTALIMDSIVEAIVAAPADAPVSYRRLEPVSTPAAETSYGEVPVYEDDDGEEEPDETP